MKLLTAALVLLSTDLTESLNCFTGVIIIPTKFEPDIKIKNCSRHADICRSTTLHFAPGKRGFTSYTSYTCDKQHLPCEAWCQMEIAIDPSIEKCSTRCCEISFCNFPQEEEEDENYVRKREEPQIIEIDLDVLPRKHSFSIPTTDRISNDHKISLSAFLWNVLSLTVLYILQ